jgi:enamine deaminase RidA (YjgF/YER057c/UK114 family)
MELRTLRPCVSGISIQQQDGRGMNRPATPLPTRSIAASPYERLAQLGIVLPSAPTPVASFVTAVRQGNLLFLSGQGPLEPGRREHQGKVGNNVSVEAAYCHARITGINLLAVMHETLGSLNKVERIVKILGMVNAVPDFAEHPRVINGCSDLMIEVFGEAIGSHARSAVGMASLPGQITVEIEAVVAVSGE